MSQAECAAQMQKIKRGMSFCFLQKLSIFAASIAVLDEK